MASTDGYSAGRHEDLPLEVEEYGTSAAAPKKPLSFHLSFLALNIMVFIVSLDATTLAVAIPVGFLVSFAVLLSRRPQIASATVWVAPSSLLPILSPARWRWAICAQLRQVDMVDGLAEDVRHQKGLPSLTA